MIEAAVNNVHSMMANQLYGEAIDRIRGAMSHIYAGERELALAALNLIIEEMK